MLRVWRITKARYAATCLDGAGAKLVGGRWNDKGVAVAYCSSTLSLATLELFVHLDPAQVPASMVAVPVELPVSLAVEVAAPPPGWDALPAGSASQRYGTDWAISQRSPVLAVPSAIVQGELNYLLNPLHPDIAMVRVLKSQPFTFDPRMVTRRP